ncbi:hypothetical protein, partial [Chryseobacterium sp.]|uniref:hypothetical protein n=1 Tax=Chryseobacterium sp. TaxID=1871047 RepID=UPI002FCCA98A
FCSSYLLTKRAPLKSGCERFYTTRLAPDLPLLFFIKVILYQVQTLGNATVLRAAAKKYQQIQINK